MPKYDDTYNTKTIVEVDSRTDLADAIADLLIVHGGSETTVQAMIEAAWLEARKHYEAERNGDSEGYRVLVTPEDGVTYALDGGLA